MNEQAQSAERTFPLQPRHEVVRQRHAFTCGPEHELAGMQDEDVVVLDLNELGEFLHVLLDVDVAHRVVAEHAEVAVDVEVDRRRLNARLVEWLDDDPAGGELFPDRTIGQDHRRRTLPARFCGKRGSDELAFDPTGRA